MKERVYLDHNATAPLRAEARDAMIAAMDIVGNPSSVHAEGRVAKGLIEKARGRISEALGASGADIVFTSSATEAAALACAERGLGGAPIEHDAVAAWIEPIVEVYHLGRAEIYHPESSVLQSANSETGILQQLPEGLAVSDMTQSFGKVPIGFAWSGVQMALISAHKIGGPKGIGALVLRQGLDVATQIKGGGQEMGRRSGTENVVGIAGFGAAAEATQRDLATGVWDRVADLRKILEKAIETEAPDTILVGKGAERLPNTACFATPGWKGETQVMSMDLAGFAISAGSACSSGKVKASKVLRAMGYDELTASSAVRVSLGPETTKDEILRFVDAWSAAHKRFQAKAA
ncbi:aminotransferase class V-fold PLP-dependent enzyme [Litoreibacter sp.]|nr:aminotransferase class V-fold PLP-dependent enzyme [Litoreibacter sp.]